jgi:hypothetical protein
LTHSIDIRLVSGAFSPALGFKIRACRSGQETHSAWGESKCHRSKFDLEFGVLAILSYYSNYVIFTDVQNGDCQYSQRGWQEESQASPSGRSIIMILCVIAASSNCIIKKNSTT